MPCYPAFPFKTITVDPSACNARPSQTRTSFIAPSNHPVGAAATVTRTDPATRRQQPRPGALRSLRRTTGPPHAVDGSQPWNIHTQSSATRKDWKVVDSHESGARAGSMKPIL